jgi:hypothetical protein
MTIPDAFYVIGGQQRAPRTLQDRNDHWYDYQKGVILHVTPATGAVETCIEYSSPPEATAEGEAVLFKAGTVVGDTLYVCTQTEVLLYQVPIFRQIGYISLPAFNDVHYVRPTPHGTLLVANTGLEMVMELTLNGDVVQIWNTLGEAPWARYDQNRDYRKGVNLKPHRSHPNYLFYIGDEPWATRFQQKDAISLLNPTRRIAIEHERVHDGVWSDGQLFFTTVNGSIVQVNPQTLAVEARTDLTQFHDDETLLGWCRGLWVETGVAWVGFSRIRPTKFRETVSWVRQGFRRSLPTHIACYDLHHNQWIQDINLEPYGLNAVFSIIPAPLLSEPTSINTTSVVALEVP